MAMEDLHDHTRPVENLRASGVLEIARLARRYLMIDDDEFRLTCAVRQRLVSGNIRFCRPGILKALACLRFLGSRPSPHDPGPAGDCCQFRELSLAQHRQAADAVALLRYRPCDLVAKGFNKSAKLLEARLVCDVVNAIELDADEDCTRHRLFCFHGREFSTNAQDMLTRAAYSRGLRFVLRMAGC
jgi:hypothetical protein